MFIDLLKNNDEDFEWYPTTDEIIECLQRDLIKWCIKNEPYNMHKNDISFHSSYAEDEKDRIDIPSFLDVGTGDGRIFDRIKGDKKNDIIIDRKLGIEKATLHADKLIRDGVWLLGRDYMETVLVDKRFSIIFSNPPYSIFNEWCMKLLKEANAAFIYLVIPERWENDLFLKAAMKGKGSFEILGEFDFEEGDRKARSKVHLIKIVCENNNDPFRSWVENNIGSFEADKEIDLDLEEAAMEESTGIACKLSGIDALVESYKVELNHLLDNFRKIGAIDFSIIAQLGVSKKDIINKIRSDIDSLKSSYWLKAFDTLSEVNKRLTYSTRQSLVNEIQWFKELDFNEGNIYSVVIWVIENFNKYTKDQMIKAFDDLTDFENVRAYKSNDKWITDNWRYSKPVPTKYSLDYRIVTNGGYKLRCCESFGSRPPDNLLVDLSIVAASLGYTNSGISDPDIGCKDYCYTMDGEVLFEYKVFKNKNIHFKINQKFLQDFNVEVGKLNGWLKSPADIQGEFELSEEEALKYFQNSSLQLITDKTCLLAA